MSRLDRMERNAAKIYAIIRISNYLPEPIYSKVQKTWIQEMIVWKSIKAAVRGRPA